MRHDSRSFIFRQVGLVESNPGAYGKPSSRIGLIDGPVDLTHPAFEGNLISKIGDSESVVAGEHATFGASILVARDADRHASRVLAMCSGCTVINFAFVTDDMLDGGLSIRDAARKLATAANLAVEAHCNTLVLGVEIRNPNARDWRPLRDSFRAALAAGSAIFLPAGNRSGVSDSTQCSWPEALVVASLDWRGNASSFSPLWGRRGNLVFAPGEDIPGAGPGSGYVVRSGTSYSAAIAGGAFALARCQWPSRSNSDIAANLFRAPHRILHSTVRFSNRPHIVENDHDASNA